MIRIILVILLSITASLSCSKKEDKKTDNTTVVTTLVSNLGQIESGFTPTSMSNSSVSIQSADFKTLSASTGPCADMDFFQCQSVLVKLYFAIGKSLVGTTAQLVSVMGTHLGKLDDGAAGTVTTNEGGSVSYSKTSASVFSVLFKNSSSEPGLYLSVNDSSYTFKVDLQKMDSSSADPVKLELNVTFTDATHWDVNLLMTNSACDVDDPGAPSKIKIILSRDSTNWIGKAMLYHPHWNPTGTNSCSVTDTIGMYTDFIGTDTATKGSLYLIPGTTSSWSSAIDTYDFSDFCTNFSSSCGSTTGLIPTSLPLIYPNPFCSTTAGVAPSFNNDCSAVDTTVSAGAYSSASLWIAPATIGTTEVTLPTSL